MNLDAWQRAMQVQNLSQRTIQERVWLVKRFEKWAEMPFEEISSETITNWLARYPNSSTRCSYYRALDAAYSWLFLMEMISANPMERVFRPREVRKSPVAITQRQLKMILDYPHSYDTRTKILFAAFAGLRIHEIAKLHSRDFNLEDGLFTVVGKGAKEVVLPLHPVLLQVAKSYRSRKYFYPSEYRIGQPVERKTVGHEISLAMRRAGVMGSAHQLRHYFATELLRGGVDPFTLQKLMRHANMCTTSRYVHIDPFENREALNALPMFDDQTLQLPTDDE